MNRRFGVAGRWPAIARLLPRTERWLIAWHGSHWSAERVTGTAVRYLCAHDLDELAAKIEGAEATPPITAD